MGKESKWNCTKEVRLEQLGVGMPAGSPSSVTPGRGFAITTFKALFPVSIFKIQYIEELHTLKGQKNTICRLPLIRKQLP